MQMNRATLTINSKNYGSWSLRGWLLCKMAGIDFVEEELPADDAASRAELLLLSPSFLVPRLVHDDVTVWDTLAIGEYLHELVPEAGLLPSGMNERARCRSICGEMHSGFVNLRAALPMNVKADHPNFMVWAGAQADIDRVTASGSTACWPRAARSSSVSARPWPMRCTRRCVADFGPTTSSSIICATTIAQRSYRCRR